MSKIWSSKSLGKYIDVITGFPFRSAKFSNGPDGIKLVRGDNVTTGNLRWGVKAKYWKDMSPTLEPFLLQDRDVIVSMDGSKVGQNYAQINKDSLPLLLVQRVARLRAQNGLIQNYLSLVISNKRFAKYIDSIQTGTSIPHISLDQIRQYSFPFPDKPEQIAISALLHSLIDKINLLKKMNRTLEQITDLIFREWFVDFNFPDENEQPYSTSGGKFLTKKMIKHPYNWELKSFGELAELFSGFSYTGKEKQNKRSGTLFVTLNNILEKGGFKTKFSWIKTNRATQRHKVKENELILANTEQTKDGRLLGCPALTIFPYDYNEKEGYFSHHITKIVPFEEKNKNFLYLLIKFNQRKIALGYNTGTTVWGFDDENFKQNFRFACPDESIIDKFNLIIGSLLQKINLNKKEILQFTEIHNYLLPRLLSNSIDSNRLKKLMVTVNV